MTLEVVIQQVFCPKKAVIREKMGRNGKESTYIYGRRPMNLIKPFGLFEAATRLTVRIDLAAVTYAPFSRVFDKFTYICLKIKLHCQMLLLQINV